MIGVAVFKGKRTCGLKTNMRNLVNFNASSQKYENLHFDGILLSKACKDLDKMTLKSDAKFAEKLTLGSKNDMRNLVNFNGSSSKIKNLHFDVLGKFKKYVCSRFPSFDATLPP